MNLFTSSHYTLCVTTQLFPTTNVYVCILTHERLYSNPSGFLMSPAYPKYYKGGRKCKWSLKVDPGQRIQVRLLDVNLRDEMRTSRERGRSERRECGTDSIRVSEKGKNLLRMCGEMKNDILLLSHGNQLEVSFVLIMT